MFVLFLPHLTTTISCPHTPQRNENMIEFYLIENLIPKISIKRIKREAANTEKTTSRKPHHT